MRLIIESPADAAACAPWTTEAEQAQAATMGVGRRNEWLSWRALVRRTLGREVEISYNALGAPEIRHGATAQDTGAATQIPVTNHSSTTADPSAAAGPESGAEKPRYLSVSHCQGSVAVLLSNRPCALDIEVLARRFGRIAARYMRPEEQALSDDSRLAAAVWCAKEAMYKYAGMKELDLLEDLRVERVDFARGTLCGRILRGARQGVYRLSLLDLGDRLAVYLG